MHFETKKAAKVLKTLATSSNFQAALHPPGCLAVIDQTQSAAIRKRCRAPTRKQRSKSRMCVSV